MKRRDWTMVLVGLACGIGWSVAAAAGAAESSWHSLIEEHGAPAWRGWKSEGFPAGWQVEGGVLSKETNAEDLVTTQEYGNFELELEWKIGKGGNSGIFYRATREYDHVYWSGPEYQLLDDEFAPDGRNRLTAAASDFALYGSPAGVVKPHDEWNKTRIVVNGNRVEHWLNGRKVVAYELKSEEWKTKVTASKFNDYKGYGMAARGLIGIQGDHDGTLAIRHARIRELP